MAIVVEHDKRKHEILQKSLDVFVEEGYEDVTFQKIADRCGITRTTLYIYFKNKHEIFLGSIKELLGEMEISLKEIANDKELSAETALRKILKSIVTQCEGNKKLFSVLLNYLMQLKKSGANPDEKVRRRVVKVRHLLNTIIIRGIQNKEFKGMNVKAMNDLVYGMLETCIFRIAVLSQSDFSDYKNTIDLAVEGFLAK